MMFKLEVRIMQGLSLSDKFEVEYDGCCNLYVFKGVKYVTSLLVLLKGKC